MFFLFVCLFWEQGCCLQFISDVSSQTVKLEKLPVNFPTPHQKHKKLAFSYVELYELFGWPLKKTEKQFSRVNMTTTKLNPDLSGFQSNLSGKIYDNIYINLECPLGIIIKINYAIMKNYSM